MRSLLLAPVHDREGFEAAIDGGADAIALDLLAPSATAEDARAMAVGLLQGTAGRTATRLFVRVHPIGSPEAEPDLLAVCPLKPVGVLLPRAEDGADLQHLGALLAVEEAKVGLEDGAIRIVALAETGAALFGLINFARASGRLDAIAWDGEALARDIGAEVAREEGGRWSDPCQTARTLLLAACADARLPAIDTVFSGASEDDFRREAEAARRDGFSGKLALDVGQAEIANAVFTRSGG